MFERFFRSIGSHPFIFLAILSIISSCCFFVFALPIIAPLPTATPTVPIPSDTPVPSASPTSTDSPVPSPTQITPTPDSAITSTPTLTPIPPSLTPSPLPTSTLYNFSRYPCIPPQTPQIARVVSVTDGDTIRVIMDGIEYRVRYIGIDTPELSEAFGTESRQKNIDLVYGQTVLMYRDQTETDAYDRLLRFVFVGDLFINDEMVRQGYANSYEYPPDTSCNNIFSQAEQFASSQGLGLWAERSAQATESAAHPTILIVTVNKGDEYVDIKNVSSAAIDLSGWKLVSERGNQSCSLAGTIQPDHVLRIWAGTSTTGFSCGNTEAIWNNSQSDPAVIYNPQDAEVDRYP